MQDKMRDISLFIALSFCNRFMRHCNPHAIAEAKAGRGNSSPIRIGCGRSLFNRNGALPQLPVSARFMARNHPAGLNHSQPFSFIRLYR
jgi:hypothetical protein